MEKINLCSLMGCGKHIPLMDMADLAKACGCPHTAGVGCSFIIKSNCTTKQTAQPHSLHNRSDSSRQPRTMQGVATARGHD
jgi:hypothetical protein